ncbi:membrane-bound alpha-1,6- mannosyltransferase Initiation-specific [Chytriomyces hyalinus]|nr:membrane-bound alpha-1,6- mannosyltransferase Initiation-specific [Chytriomyces hyalinus]
MNEESVDAFVEALKAEDRTLEHFDVSRCQLGDSLAAKVLNLSTKEFSVDVSSNGITGDAQFTEVFCNKILAGDIFRWEFEDDKLSLEFFKKTAEALATMGRQKYDEWTKLIDEAWDNHCKEQLAQKPAAEEEKEEEEITEEVTQAAEGEEAVAVPLTKKDMHAETAVEPFSELTFEDCLMDNERVAALFSCIPDWTYPVIKLTNCGLDDTVIDLLLERLTISPLKLAGHIVLNGNFSHVLQVGVSNNKYAGNNLTERGLEKALLALKNLDKIRLLGSYEYPRDQFSIYCQEIPVSADFYRKWEFFASELQTVQFYMNSVEEIISDFMKLVSKSKHATRRDALAALVILAALSAAFSWSLYAHMDTVKEQLQPNTNQVPLEHSSFTESTAFQPTPSSSIPQLIFQIFKSSRKEDWNSRRPFIESWTRLNPTFGHTVVDDDAALEFVEKHFDSDVLDAYRSFPLIVSRTDLLRYLLIWEHGGLYTDADTVCEKSIGESFATWTEGRGDVLFISSIEQWFKDESQPDSRPSTSITQWSFAAARRHPILGNLIREITNATLRATPQFLRDRNNVIGFTGPSIYSRHIREFMLEFGEDLEAAVVASKVGPWWFPKSKVLILPRNAFMADATWNHGIELGDAYGFVSHKFAGNWEDGWKMKDNNSDK